MQLDADEYFEKNDKNELRKVLQSDFDILTFEYWNHFNKKIFLTGSQRPVVFNKKKIYFIASPHEEVKPINNNTKIIHSHLRLQHQPNYLDNSILKTGIAKAKRWTPLQATSTLNWEKTRKYNYHDQPIMLTTKLMNIIPVICGLFILPATSVLALFNYKKYINRQNWNLYIELVLSGIIYYFYLTKEIVKLKIKPLFNLS